VKQHEKLIRLAQVFWHYKIHSTVLPYYPVRVWLETTNQCNLRCTVCPNASDTQSRRGNMDISLYESIIDQLAGNVYDLNLSHRGEPLFHPELESMIQMASKRKIATRIHTNATLLDVSRSRSLLKAGPDLVSFSFDGYDKETYESVRIGGQFEDVFENIRMFLSEKKRLGLTKPYTVMQIIEPCDVSELYLERLASFGKTVRNLGLDKFYVKKPHNWAGNASGDYSLSEQSVICTFLYYSMTILWSGIVCPCPQDWYGSLYMGDATEQTIEDIWNGTRYRDMRRRVAEGDFSGCLCDRCDRVFRDSFLGIPTENIKSFIGETLAGYNWSRKLIRK
jgi:sulfatase maturation enzyme AslB (radical SAM superfamily)